MTNFTLSDSASAEESKGEKAADLRDEIELLKREL